MQTETIHIPLLNEGTELWRPVVAKKISDALFRIEGTTPADEEWMYVPGQIVTVQQRSWQDGKQGLAAIQVAPQARFDVSMDELRIINNALNEICNGIDLGAEFETRIGASLSESRTLLERIHVMLT